MSAFFSACRRWRKAIRHEVLEIGSEKPPGLGAHLSNCAGCRRYAEEIGHATAAVSALSRRAVPPSPWLRSRWTTAVHKIGRPSSFSEFVANALRQCSEFLRRNRRPLFALAPVWLAILLLKFTAPAAEPSPSASPIHSPAEILRTLKSEHAELVHPLAAPSDPAKSDSGDESRLEPKDQRLCALVQRLVPEDVSSLNPPSCRI